MYPVSLSTYRSFIPLYRLELVNIFVHPAFPKHLFVNQSFD